MMFSFRNGLLLWVLLTALAVHCAAAKESKGRNGNEDGATEKNTRDACLIDTGVVRMCVSKPNSDVTVNECFFGDVQGEILADGCPAEVFMGTCQQPSQTSEYYYDYQLDEEAASSFCEATGGQYSSSPTVYDNDAGNIFGVAGDIVLLGAVPGDTLSGSLATFVGEVSQETAETGIPQIRFSPDEQWPVGHHELTIEYSKSPDVTLKVLILPEIIHISPDGSNVNTGTADSPLDDITHFIELSQIVYDHPEVKVAAGEYIFINENENTGDETVYREPIEITGSITLSGSYSTDYSMQDIDSYRSRIVAYGDMTPIQVSHESEASENVSISNFFIEADNDDSDEELFSLISVAHHGTISINNNIFEIGATDTSVGLNGIYFSSTDNDGGQVQNNEFQVYGANIGIAGSNINGGTIEISGNEFDNPYIDEQYQAFLFAGDFLVEQNTFLIGAKVCSSVSATTSKECGGTRFIDNAFFGSARVYLHGDSTRFIGNRLEGYIYLEGNNDFVANNLIAGRVFTDGVDSLRFINNTVYFTGNIVEVDGDNSEFSNNILVGVSDHGFYEANTASDSAATPNTFRNNVIFGVAPYQDIDGACGGFPYDCINIGEFEALSDLSASGNIDSDPMLIDLNGLDGDPFTLADNDWRLSVLSPAGVQTGGINGAHSSENWGVTDDFADTTRSPIDDTSTTGWSIGAYEY